MLNLRKDRIARAIEIIRADNPEITEIGAGVFRVRSQSSRSRYTVTVTDDGGVCCTCPDARPDAHGVRPVCKHAWSSAGRDAAIAVDYFRLADSLDLLRYAGECLALCPVPEYFLLIARFEYRQAHARLMTAATSSQRRMAA